MQRLCVAAIAAMLALSCKKAEVPAPAAQSPAQPAPQEISITTKVPQAAELYRQARAAQANQRGADSIDLYSKALAADPDLALAHAALALLKGPGPEQKQHADRAAALAAALPEGERALVEFVLANVHGDRPAGAAALKKLAAAGAGDSYAQFLIGEDAFFEKKYDDAAAALQRAIRLDPKNGGALNQLGYVYVQQKRWDDAVAAFHRYAEALPAEPNAHDSLAEALLTSGKVGEADAEFVKAAQAGLAQAWEGAAIARFYGADWKGGRDALSKQEAAARDPRARLVARLDAATSLLFEHKSKEALAGMAAVEKEAEAQKLLQPQLRAILTQAIASVETGHPKDALSHLDHGDKVVAASGMAPGQRAGWEVGALRARIWALSRGGHAGDAQKLLPQLQKVVDADMGTRFAQSAVHFAHGVIALAEKQPGHAAEELARCDQQDELCTEERIAALHKAGDKAGADAAKAAFFGTLDRNLLAVLVRQELGGLPAGKPATASK